MRIGPSFIEPKHIPLGERAPNEPAARVDTLERKRGRRASPIVRFIAAGIIGVGAALGLGGCTTVQVAQDGASNAVTSSERLHLRAPQLQYASAIATDGIHSSWVSSNLQFGKGLEFSLVEQQALSQTMTSMRPLFCDNTKLRYALKVESIDVRKADGTTMPGGGVALSPQGAVVLQAHTVAAAAYKLYAHELTHWLFGFEDPVTCKSYRSMADNPLVQEWMSKLGWTKFGERASAGFEAPPTTYGATDAGEDIAESVMMFMTERDRLRTDSPQRYAFIVELFRRVKAEVPGELRVEDLPSEPAGLKLIQEIPQRVS